MIVTVQGDEPLITPQMINLTIKKLLKKRMNYFAPHLHKKLYQNRKLIIQQS